MDSFIEKLRSELEEVQAQLKERNVEATSAEGMVRVTANGHQEITAIFLEPGALYPKNQGPLQKALAEAANEAIRLSREMLKEEVSRLTGGMDMSNFPDLF